MRHVHRFLAHCHLCLTVARQRGILTLLVYHTTSLLQDRLCLIVALYADITITHRHHYAQDDEYNLRYAPNQNDIIPF